MKRASLTELPPRLVATPAVGGGDHEERADDNPEAPEDSAAAGACLFVFSLHAGAEVLALFLQISAHLNGEARARRGICFSFPALEIDNRLSKRLGMVLHVAEGGGKVARGQRSAGAIAGKLIVVVIIVILHEFLLEFVYELFLALSGELGGA